MVDARIIMRDNFDAILKNHDDVVIFGEDAGIIGDVNQGLEGLQDNYGEVRVADTGIREATIIGKVLASDERFKTYCRNSIFRLFLYCYSNLSDDLATLLRTIGKQIAPLIIRTRGHRLEGIWHSGSPMGGMINLLRGIHV